MEPVVSIIATHQARIRCILRTLTGNTEDDIPKIHRFMNGAVIKLTIDGDVGEVALEIVNDGYDDSAHGNKKYYVGEKKDSRLRVTFPFARGEEARKALYKKMNIAENVKGKYVFFIIRHGQATHNTEKGISKLWQSTAGKKDTELTDQGKMQAQKVAEAMSKNKEFLSAQYLFCSDLRRTMQTLSIIVGGAHSIAKKEGIVEMPHKIIILPCSHELNYRSSGDCDGVNFKQIVQAEENKPCSVFGGEEGLHSTCLTAIPWQHEPEAGADSKEQFALDWKYYREFYGTGEVLGLRGDRKTGRSKCRDTNFLLQAISIINRQSKKGGSGRRAPKRRRKKRTVKGSSKKSRVNSNRRGNMRKRQSRRRHRRTKRRL